MDAIEAACAQSRKENGEMKTSNFFYANGKRYFYEISRRDQPDGGIAGTINLIWTDAEGKDWCRKVGTFRIDGKGRVVRGPKLFREAKPVPWIVAKGPHGAAAVAEANAWLDRLGENKRNELIKLKMNNAPWGITRDWVEEQGGDREWDKLFYIGTGR